MERESDIVRYGGAGIDTDYEREKINYDPKFEYVPEESQVEDDYTTTAGDYELDDIGDVNTLPIWENLIETIDKLTELEENLSEKLKDIKVPIPERYLTMVKEAAKAFGIDVTDTIPFELYKLTFTRPHSGEAVLIQDIFEDYQADVNGELNAELYSDIVEMQQDLDEAVVFTKMALFAQLVAVSELPSDQKKDNANVEHIHQVEKKMMEDYTMARKMDDVNEQIWFELSAMEYGSDRYYRAEKEFVDGKRTTRQMERRVYTKDEVSNLIQLKLGAVSYTTELVENTIDYVPFQNEERDVLFNILKQYKTKGDAEKGLQQIQALTKLSVDGKKGQTDEAKSNLRGVAGLTNRKKINQNLVNGVHMRNEVAAQVHDRFDYFDGVPDSSAFELFASHITDGIRRANDVYVEQTADFYKMHEMESMLRGERVRKLIDKDGTRTVHKILGKVLKYIKETDKWPDEASLSTWLDDFAEQQKF